MKRILAVLVMSAVMLSGCMAGENKQEADSGKVSVVTSFYAMYDFAQLIAGDKAEIYNLSEGGEEAHDFEPSAADIVKIEESDIFIYNGNGMEGWADKVVGSVKNDVVIVEASENVEISENSDPHIWLDPENAYIQMENICNALCEADGENAEYYKANLSECAKKLDELDKNFSDRIEKGKKIVVSHEAYGYLCKAYGMEQIPLSGLFAEGDASPAKIAEVIEFVKNNGIKYIYAENMGSDKTVQTVAEGAGAEVLVLSPFEGETEGRNYFEVMQANLEALTK